MERVREDAAGLESHGVNAGAPSEGGPQEKCPGRNRQLGVGGGDRTLPCRPH